MSIDQATTFWIEAGAMSSASRHQIEFPNDLAEFFDDVARDSEIVTIRLPNGSTQVRPLVYRGTDYGQWSEQWRLHLPTREMGGPDYPGKIIRFDRVRVGNSIVYELRVVEQSTAEAIELEDKAKQVGTIESTGGGAGRQYGYW